MTNSDKTEISNLLSNIAEMRKTADNANRKYNDPKISAYCVAAIEDAAQTKKYITDVIAKNLGLFIDFKKIKLWNSICGNRDIDDVAAHRPITIQASNDMTLKIRFSYSIAKSIPRGLYEEVTFSCEPDDVELVDIWMRTSDTSRPEYSICSWEDMYYKPQKDWVFIPTGRWNAMDWSIIYAKAKRTRAYTEWMLADFKKTLAAKAAGLKEIADESDAIREKNMAVETYVKVSI